jgi:hypothetical protein
MPFAGWHTGGRALGLQSRERRSNYTPAKLFGCGLLGRPEGARIGICNGTMLCLQREGDLPWHHRPHGSGYLETSRPWVSLDGTQAGCRKARETCQTRIGLTSGKSPNPAKKIEAGTLRWGGYPTGAVGVPGNDCFSAPALTMRPLNFILLCGLSE